LILIRHCLPTASALRARLPAFRRKTDHGSGRGDDINLGGCNAASQKNSCQTVR
jgi:hypothetical protein